MEDAALMFHVKQPGAHLSPDRSAAVEPVGGAKTYYCAIPLLIIPRRVEAARVALLLLVTRPSPGRGLIHKSGNLCQRWAVLKQGFT